MPGLSASALTGAGATSSGSAAAAATGAKTARAAIHALIPLIAIWSPSENEALSGISCRGRRVGSLRRDVARGRRTQVAAEAVDEGARVLIAEVERDGRH